jgi:hypothetical protein
MAYIDIDSWLFNVSLNGSFSNNVNGEDYASSVVNERNMNIENCWNYVGGGKLRYLEKNLSHCHFVHNKSHVDCPGIEATRTFQDHTGSK